MVVLGNQTLHPLPGNVPATRSRLVASDDD